MKRAAKTTILHSIITIVLCIALMCGATMALFTSGADVNIAVTSGKVNVVATPSIAKATTKEWDAEHNVYNDINCLEDGKAEFATGGTASIDGKKVNLDRIMPGDSVTVQIEIFNQSTIDIKYQLQATFEDDEGLLSALEIGLECDNNIALEIFDGDFKHTATGGGYDKASKWQTMPAGSPTAPAMATLDLTITFPFPADLDTMKHEDQSATIKLALYAVQGNRHTVDPTTPTEHVTTPGEQVTISAKDLDTYKTLTAATVSDKDFLYWAFKPSGAVAARAALSTYAQTQDHGSYVSNSPVYKFRVTEETLGTYTPIYRNASNDSKVVRLTPGSAEYQIAQEDLGKELTFVAQQDTWYAFKGFKLGEEERSSDEEFTCSIRPVQGDEGKVLTAEYTDFTLDDYENYYDNTGAINYEAEIVEKNVERKIPDKYECGGIDGVFTVGEFKGAGSEFENELYEIALDDYPIYGKGYTNYKSNQINKDPETKQKYTKLNKAVFDETIALSQVGNYFMDKEGKLWGEKELTSEEYWQWYKALALEFAKEYSETHPGLLDDMKFEASTDPRYPDSFDIIWSNDPQIDEQCVQAFTDYFYENMDSSVIALVEVGHLYKHPESQNMYLGDVSKDEPAVEKRITATARGTTQGWSPTITGLYAPAGEIITFKMSEADMERTGGMILTIGMVQMTGERFSFGVEKYPSRPAFITAKTTITPNTKHPDTVQFFDEATQEYTFYFGSYIGGPIYVSPVNPGTSFTIDIRGGVEYQHYIYGYTTQAEFESRKNTTAPYFECWVASEDVRFVGPFSQVKNFTYENYVKVSRLWENVARISKRFPSQTNSEYGVMMMFETYVQSGAACAFAGANTVDSPYGWMGGSLGYDTIVESGGWGNFHEFNHCYQYFGIGADSEVSNNTVNLVEYALLTEISAHRDVDAEGISTRYTGWESYTDPAFALRVLTGGNPANGSRDKNLCRYVNLFYAFGLDRYVNMTQITSHDGGQIWGSSRGAYPFFKGACEGSGYNMKYYFNEILFPESDQAYSKYHIDTNNDYLKKDYEETYSQFPMFVPVACTYQTGVGYAFDPETGNGVNARTHTGKVQWEYTTTSRPFRIDFSQQSFTLDFEKTLALPGRSKYTEWKDTQFNWTIECTTQPEHGHIDPKGDGSKNFTYTLDNAAKTARTSGRMVFTVEYDGKEGTPAQGIVGSMQIVVEFDAKPGSIREYEHLDRTTYTFAEGIEEDKDSEGSEGSEGVATVAETVPETKSPFETECDNWTANLQKYDGTFSGALYVTTEENTLPEDKEGENNTAVYFDEELHPAPADSFVVVSGIYTPKESGTYYLGIESGHKAAALYLSTDGKTYTLHVSASQNPSGVLYQEVPVIKVAKQYAFTANKPVYFREVLAIDPEASDNHIKMIWGNAGCTVGDLSDRLTNPTDPNHVGCAYCVKDDSKSYELEYLEARDQYYIEKTTATQEMVEVEAKNGFSIDKELPGFIKASAEFFFDKDLYNPFSVTGSSGKLTIIGKMSEKVTANFFTIRTDADKDPHSYKLYVGSTYAEDSKTITDEVLVFEQNWSEYGSRPRLQRTGTLEHLFDCGEKTFRYYRLEVTATSGKLILYGIEFGTTWNVKQPSDRDVEKLGAWEDVRASGATFGYLLTAKGKTNNEPFSTITMKFTGTQLHIRALKGPEYGAVEVLIDGEWVADIDLRHSEKGWADILSSSFLAEDTLKKISDALSGGTEHTLTLRSTERFNVDAVYYR